MVALKAALGARAGLSGVQITDGLPWQPDKDFITIGNADPHEQDPSGMAGAGVAGGREEQFTLTLLISAFRTGDADHTEVVARAYVLAAEIEGALRDDVTIGGSLGASGFAYVSGLPVRKLGPDKNGNREAQVRARLSCHAVD